MALLLAGCGGAASDSKPASINAGLILDQSRVQPGGTVAGRLVVENRTSKALVLLSGCRVDGFYAVGLRASDGFIQEPAFSAVGCSPQQKLVAKPGTTVYRFKIRAAYTECSQSARHQLPKGSKYWSPLCLKDSKGERDIMPPLPSGKYTAVFFPAGRWKGAAVTPAHLVIG